jgi:serine phosphatase RsbU (regulator of sigma subunit)
VATTGRAYGGSGGLLVPLLGVQSLVIVVVVGGLAGLIYATGASRLESGFDRSGSSVVTALAAFDPACSGTGHATSAEASTWMRAAALGQDKLLAGLSPDARRLATEHDTRRRKINQERFAALTAGKKNADIVAVSIGGMGGDTGSEFGGIVGPERQLTGGVSVAGGTFKGVPARRFRTQIHGSESHATVILSEVSLRVGKAKLAQMAILLAALAIAAAIGVAYGALARVLRPLRQLATEVQAIASGRYDRTVHTRGGGEIRRVVTAVEEMAQGLAAGKVLRAESEEVGRELALGVEVQSNLLPDRIPMLPGLDVGAFSRPATEVGGDYYDFLELPGGRLGLGIFDVSGHGVSGAIVMAMVRSLLHEVAVNSGGPAQTMRRLNAALHRDLKRGMFTTGIYAEYDPGRRSISLCNAGHNPAWIHRSATRRMEQLRPGAPALGLADPATFDNALKEAEISLDLGDRVILYTDGTVETVNARGEQFGEARFQGLVAHHASRESNAFINLVVDALETFRGDAPPEDDLTMITFALTV